MPDPKKPESVDPDEKRITPEDQIQAIMEGGNPFGDLVVGPEDHPPFDPASDAERIANGNW